MPFTAVADISGLFVFEPRIFADERGYFFESFHHQQFCEATGFKGEFVQDNQSRSHFGVMRGLHFQLAPHAQSKLVRVTQGEVFDVAVDVRKDSPTYGKHFGVKLSAENKKQFFIPKGFAHGFVVLSESADLLYKCDGYYAPQSEGGLLYNDPNLGIDWGIDTNKMIVSGKDLILKPLSEQENLFF